MLNIRNPTKQRGWLNFPCPYAPWLHQRGVDSRPSAGVMIVPDGRSFFYCFTCKKKHPFYDLPTGLGRYAEEDYSDITRDILLAEVSNIPTWDDGDEPDEEIEPLSEAAYGDLYPCAWDYDAAKRYLADRDIDEATVRKLGIGWDDHEMRVTFPVRDHEGRLFGFSGRTVLDEDAYPKKNYPRIRDYYGLPKRMMMLGEHLWESGKPVLIVEGLFGYAHLHKIGAGDLFNIGALMGSEMTEAKAAIIVDWGEPTYLAPDPDMGGDSCLYGTFDAEEGDHSGNGAIDKLHWQVQLFVPDWPEGVDDPDELTMEHLELWIEETPEYDKNA